jgi:GNAT superfamily N-acetyltransferase
MLDHRMPAGKDIVDEYIPRMLERCEQCRGIILVAEVDGEVAGYATVLTKVTSDELEDGDLEYGLVSDLVVTKEFRGQGLGRHLLQAAESFAKAGDVNWLRIGVLAGNRAAQNLYTSMGYSNLYVELEKDLTGSQ